MQQKKIECKKSQNNHPHKSKNKKRALIYTQKISHEPSNKDLFHLQ